MQRCIESFGHVDMSRLDRGVDKLRCPSGGRSPGPRASKGAYRTSGRRLNTTRLDFAVS
jgi:hypothetical protein